LGIDGIHFAVCSSVAIVAQPAHFSVGTNATKPPHIRRRLSMRGEPSLPCACKKAAGNQSICFGCSVNTFSIATGWSQQSSSIGYRYRHRRGCIENQKPPEKWFTKWLTIIVRRG
jgi:hypothetical protein